MLFKRTLINSDSSLPMPSRQGTGMMDNVSVLEVTADAAQTITTAQMAGGAILYTGFSAGRNLTTPTAALLVAATPNMDIGDSFNFMVSIQDAFAGTWVAGDAGVTLRGRTTTPASSWSMVVVTKTGAATFDWIVL